MCTSRNKQFAMMTAKTTTVMLVFAYNCIFVRSVPIPTVAVEAENQTISDELSERTSLRETTCNSDGRFAWRPVGFEYPAGVQQLHIEIAQFYKYMQPTPIERAMRIQVKARIETVVQQAWPDAHVEAIGSFMNGLVLPNSDIDLMVIGASGQSPLRLLATKILESGIAESDSLQVKCDVRIPIIEFVDSKSKLSIDMLMRNEPTFKVAPMIDEFQQQHPVLFKLLLVLKQYIKQRDLNNVFTGGISSYALTLMCISFLQKHPTYEPNDDTNMGELLLDFFELYGRNFDYENMGITIKDGGKYLPRNVMPCDGAKQLFCIEDAVNDWLNACSMTYRGPDVKEVFNDAYTILSTAISSGQNSTKDCAEISLLGKIVHLSNGFLNYRTWVRDTFENTL